MTTTTPTRKKTIAWACEDEEEDGEEEEESSEDEVFDKEDIANDEEEDRFDHSEICYLKKIWASLKFTRVKLVLRAKG